MRDSGVVMKIEKAALDLQKKGDDRLTDCSHRGNRIAIHDHITDPISVIAH